jgi:hypothetical protein
MLNAAHPRLGILTNSQILLIVVGAGGLSAQRALWARRYPREGAG